MHENAVKPLKHLRAYGINEIEMADHGVKSE